MLWHLQQLFFYSLFCSAEQFQVWVIYGAGPNDANASDTFSLGSDFRHSSRLSCLYGVT